MGQYYYVVNLTKKEFLHPHKLGDGLKLQEQLNSTGGTMAALYLLLTCSNGRGGGDVFAPATDAELTMRVEEMVGRWAGDAIAIVGDYAEDADLPPKHEAGNIYERCRKGEFRDISDEILPVVELACNVRITGSGWRRKESGRAAIVPGHDCPIKC